MLAFQFKGQISKNYDKRKFKSVNIESSTFFYFTPRVNKDVYKFNEGIPCEVDAYAAALELIPERVSWLFHLLPLPDHWRFQLLWHALRQHITYSRCAFMWGTNPRRFKTTFHSRIRCYYRLSLQKWTFSSVKQAAGVATPNCFIPIFSSKSLIPKYNNRWGSFHWELGRWSNIYSLSNCMVAVATLALRKALE